MIRARESLVPANTCTGAQLNIRPTITLGLDEGLFLLTGSIVA